MKIFFLLLLMSLGVAKSVDTITVVLTNTTEFEQSVEASDVMCKFLSDINATSDTYGVLRDPKSDKLVYILESICKNILEPVIKKVLIPIPLAPTFTTINGASSSDPLDTNGPTVTEANTDATTENSSDAVPTEADSATGIAETEANTDAITENSSDAVPTDANPATGIAETEANTDATTENSSDAVPTDADPATGIAETEANTDAITETSSDAAPTDADPASGTTVTDEITVPITENSKDADQTDADTALADTNTVASTENISDLDQTDAEIATVPTLADITTVATTLSGNSDVTGIPPAVTLPIIDSSTKGTTIVVSSTSKKPVTVTSTRRTTIEPPPTPEKRTSFGAGEIVCAVLFSFIAGVLVAVAVKMFYKRYRARTYELPPEQNAEP